MFGERNGNHIQPSVSMYRYNVYIMKHLTSTVALVTVSLTSIIWLTQALRFIDFIVHRGISFIGFLELTLLLIPSLMLFILPFALLCGVLFVYYRLMMDSELHAAEARAGKHEQFLRRVRAGSAPFDPRPHLGRPQPVDSRHR